MPSRLRCVGPLARARRRAARVDAGALARRDHVGGNARRSARCGIPRARWRRAALDAGRPRVPRTCPQRGRADPWRARAARRRMGASGRTLPRVARRVVASRPAKRAGRAHRDHGLRASSGRASRGARRLPRSATEPCCAAHWCRGCPCSIAALRWIPRRRSFSSPCPRSTWSGCAASCCAARSFRAWGSLHDSSSARALVRNSRGARRCDARAGGTRDDERNRARGATLGRFAPGAGRSASAPAALRGAFAALPRLLATGRASAGSVSGTTGRDTDALPRAHRRLGGRRSARDRTAAARSDRTCGASGVATRACRHGERRDRSRAHGRVRPARPRAAFRLRAGGRADASARIARAPLRDR